MWKRVSRHMPTAKAQISLCIGAVWSVPSLSANRNTGYCRCIHGEQRSGCYLAHAQDELNVAFCECSTVLFCLTRPMNNACHRTDQTACSRLLVSTHILSRLRFCLLNVACRSYQRRELKVKSLMFTQINYSRSRKKVFSANMRTVNAKISRTIPVSSLFAHRQT